MLVQVKDQHNVTSTSQRAMAGVGLSPFMKLSPIYESRFKVFNNNNNKDHGMERPWLTDDAKKTIDGEMLRRIPIKQIIWSSELIQKTNSKNLAKGSQILNHTPTTELVPIPQSDPRHQSNVDSSVDSANLKGDSLEQPNPSTNQEDFSWDALLDDHYYNHVTMLPSGNELEFLNLSLPASLQSEETRSNEARNKAEVEVEVEAESNQDQRTKVNQVIHVDHEEANQRNQEVQPENTTQPKRAQKGATPQVSSQTAEMFATENEQVEDEPPLGEGFTRSMIKILSELLPTLKLKKGEKIQLKLSGDGFNIGKKVQNVHLAFGILNNSKKRISAKKHHTVLQYRGGENYDLVKVSEEGRENKEEENQETTFLTTFSICN